MDPDLDLDLDLESPRSGYCAGTPSCMLSVCPSLYTRIGPRFLETLAPRIVPMQKGYGGCGSNENESKTGNVSFLEVHRRRSRLWSAKEHYAPILASWLPHSIIIRGLHVSKYHLFILGTNHLLHLHTTPSNQNVVA